MATITSKLPTSDQPIIVDRTLAAAVESMIAPYSGARLERAQAAIRKVAMSAVQGPYDTILTAYRRAIQSATGDKE